MPLTGVLFYFSFLFFFCFKEWTDAHNMPLLRTSAKLGFGVAFAFRLATFEFVAKYHFEGIAYVSDVVFLFLGYNV